MIKNKYGVAPALWRKFKGDKSKKLFNDIVEQALPNQSITTHPKTKLMPPGQWSTICHNFACYAVWAMEGDVLEKGQDVHIVGKKGQVLKTVKAK